MMTTEEEAKKKWCCVGYANGKEALKCGGSECMAWRWPPDKDGEMMRKVGNEYFEVGYCGLAGREYP